MPKSAHHSSRIFSGPRILRVFLGIYFLAFLVFPLLTLFGTMLHTDVLSVLRGPVFLQALKNSLFTSFCTALGSTLIAFCMAFCLTRANVPFSGVFRGLFLLPMLVPSISLGTGLVMLLGRNGILTRLFSLSFSIYGPHGVIAGEILYTAPILFLLFLSALSQEDYTPHEAAISLGIPAPARLRSLTLSSLKGSFLAGAFLAFTLSLSDYGVPLSVGGKFPTLSTILYSEVAGKLDFGKGSVIGTLLLIPAFLAFLADQAREKSSAGRFVTSAFVPGNNRKRDRAALAFCAVTALVFALPFAAFLFLTFVKDYPLQMTFTAEHLLAVLQGKAARFLGHSLLISGCSALLGAALAFPVAYFAVRRPTPFSRLLHLLAIFPMAVPGMVLGLAFLLFFRKTPLYGTFTILICADTVHFFSSPYLMLCHTLEEQNENLEAVGETLGIPVRRLVLSVLLPACASSLRRLGAYFFINNMVTISAVSFLASSSTRPLSLLITQYADQLNLEGAAALSFVILLINLVFSRFL